MRQISEFSTISKFKKRVASIVSSETIWGNTVVISCVTAYTESLKAPKTVPNDPKVLEVNL